VPKRKEEAVPVEVVEVLLAAAAALPTTTK
jgi:hypothetical protein